MTKDVSQIQWLVRKRGRMVDEILGPYWTDQVQAMVEKGTLAANDELCPENGYWFSLHEVEEVTKFLKIEAVTVRRVLSDAEVTEPNFEAPTPSMSNQSEPLPARVTPATPAPDASFRTGGARPASLRLEKSQVLVFLFVLGLMCALGAVMWMIRSLRE